MFNKESYDLWKQRIHEQRTSGMKIREWCEKYQLSPHAYYYWRKLISAHQNVLTDSNTTAFVEFPKIEMDPTSSCGILLTWKDVSIQISSKQEANLAAEVIRALQSPC